MTHEDADGTSSGSPRQTTQEKTLTADGMESNMDWMTFNRELQNRVTDPGVRYMLGLVYERLLDVSKQTDAAGTIMLEMANTMNSLVGLNEHLDNQVKGLRRHMTGQVDGVSVESVPLTNEE
jgi:hypothetical protein